MSRPTFSWPAEWRTAPVVVEASPLVLVAVVEMLARLERDAGREGES